MLSDTSNMNRKKNVAMTEIGIEKPMITVLELRRNRNSTKTASTPPMIAVLSTSLTDCSIKVDWSNTTSMFTSPDTPETFSCTSLSLLFTPWATLTVLLPASL